jgi:outer membrane immunogenic protein
MRRCLLVAVLFGAVTSAHAADLPALRGGFYDNGPRAVNWGGFYGGLQGGYGSSDTALNLWPNYQAATLASGYTVLSAMGFAGWVPGFDRQNTHTALWGAFGGYNLQYEDVVIGLEGSYAHGDFGATQTRSASVSSVLGAYNYAVTGAETSTVSITDMATLRARAGYVWGCFLPYVFGGLALGNADYTKSATYQGSVAPLGGPSTSLVPLSLTDATHNHFVYGYSAGTGFDYRLMGGLFLRAEYEYVRFKTSVATAPVDVTVNSVRAGLGYKF